ncbi:membrane protein insertase YidC [Mycoplasmopsis iners]|uniref:membrane protein insertase YidC n=1 Tax=Mycoplasmopsis iners TaxID=76630 RepID=UPI00068D0A04|nr:membrane protein insertase YidC [Mycoplasmopsis iners]
MKDNNRSKNFDYFTKKGNEENQRKNVLKRIWFWIKVVLYTFIFGVTMTGCIQSMVVKTSSYSGAGTEFYLNKNDIAPSVSTFIAGSKPKDDTYLKDGQFYELKLDKERNFLLSSRDNSETLKAIQTQTTENGGEYGKYASYSSSIQYVLKNGAYSTQSPILSQNGKYLFKAASTKSYSSIYGDQLSSIQFLNPSFSIANFFTPVKDGNGNITGYKLITDNDDLYSIKGEYWNNSTKKSTQEKYVIAEARTVQVKNTFSADQANLAYNRDVLEFLYRETFLNPSENSYYDEAFKNNEFINGANFIEKYQNIMRGITTSATRRSLDWTFTPSELHALIKYEQVLNSYLKNVDYLGVENSNNIPLKAKNADGEIVDAVDQNGKTIYTNVINDDYQAGQRSSDLSKMAYQSDIPQKAIYSWKGAWELGPFFALLAYPMAIVTAGIRNPLPDAAGWTTILAIIVAVLITRLIALAFTWKATISQSRQEELKQKKAKIDAKYAEFKNNKQMKARQQQEIQQLYKKHGINPLDTLMSTLIALPIFIAMWRVIQSVPSLKSTHWLGMDFSATSWRNLIYEGQWQYLGLLIAAIATQILSQLLPRLLNRRRLKQRITIEEAKAIKKSNKTQNIMLIVFLIFTVMFTAGIQIYWIFTSIWTIFQTLLIHWIKKTAWYRRKFLSKVAV